jgi:hypothetical protein
VLRQGLCKKLAACTSIADVEAWEAKHKEALGVLQDDDGRYVVEAVQTRLDEVVEIAERSAAEAA